jgi:hypothetical protein
MCGCGLLRVMRTKIAPNNLPAAEFNLETILNGNVLTAELGALIYCRSEEFFTGRFMPGNALFAAKLA